MSGPETLERLGELVAREQDGWLDRAVPLEPVRDGFLLRAGAARRGRRALWLVAAALVVGAVGSAAALLGSRYVGSVPLQASVNGHAAPQDAWIHSQHAEKLPIDFSDGSRVTLEPGSRVRLAELRASGATLAVEAGSLEVSVKHRAQTDYRLSLGPFLVRVTGTRFNVSFTPDQDLLRLDMREGTVVVSGCALGEARPLRAGESLSASCREGRFEISRGAVALPASEAAPAKPNSVQNDAPVQAPGRDARTEGEPSWQSLARAGKFQRALASVEAGAGFSAVSERANAEELALLADMARLASRPEQAISALSSLRKRFPGGQRASVAAFNIARVYFDQRAAYDEAAQWFRTYLREQPAGPLVREAQGRLMEALYRSGDRAGATRIANEYLAANPSGPHARFARTLLAR